MFQLLGTVHYHYSTLPGTHYLGQYTTTTGTHSYAGGHSVVGSLNGYIFSMLESAHDVPTTCTTTVHYLVHTTWYSTLPLQVHTLIPEGIASSGLL